MSDSDERKDFVFKITVIGDGGVGKTSLIKKYTKGSFKKEYIKTLGAQFSKYDEKIAKEFNSTGDWSDFMGRLKEDALVQEKNKEV